MTAFRSTWLASWRVSLKRRESSSSRPCSGRATWISFCARVSQGQKQGAYLAVGTHLKGGSRVDVLPGTVSCCVSVPVSLTEGQRPSRQRPSCQEHPGCRGWPAPRSWPREAWASSGPWSSRPRQCRRRSDWGGVSMSDRHETLPPKDPRNGRVLGLVVVDLKHVRVDGNLLTEGAETCDG